MGRMSRTKNAQRVAYQALGRGPSRKLHRRRSDYKHVPTPVTMPKRRRGVPGLLATIHERPLVFGWSVDSKTGRRELLRTDPRHKQDARKRRARRQLRNLGMKP